MTYLKQSAVCLCIITMAACSSTKNTAKVNRTSPMKPNDICASVAYNTDTPHISWKEETANVLQGSTNTIALPPVYKLYSADKQQLDRFFTASNKEMAMVEAAIPLPDGLGCTVFTFRESGTMSPDLKKKYPLMASLKGADAANSMDARLEYDGNRLTGQVIAPGGVYMVTPVNTGKQYYYVIYKKADVDGKQPVDQAPPKAEPAQRNIKLYDR